MKKMVVFVWFVAMISCRENVQGQDFIFQKKLPQKLREVSGIAIDGEFIWAISDTKGSNVFKLGKTGNVIQELKITNVDFEDVEAVAVDADYLYIADIGDNRGKRPVRTIMKVKKSAIGSASNVQVSGEVIRFSFADGKEAKKESENNYDAEALLNYKDSLYIFTKRRGDEETELYALSKMPGTYKARSLALFDSKRLITDVAINEAGNEIALVGYLSGHQKPFVWLLTGFSGNNFFSGSQKRFKLPTKIKDWQVEGIAYKDDNSFYLTCEETSDESATLYSIAKKVLVASKKKEN